MASIVSAADDAFARHPEAEALLLQTLESISKEIPELDELRNKLKTVSNTGLCDWLDHLVIHDDAQGTYLAQLCALGTNVACLFLKFSCQALKWKKLLKLQLAILCIGTPEQCFLVYCSEVVLQLLRLCAYL